MKIKSVTDAGIVFDNGDTIRYFHDQDCCESNYADFEQLDDIARNYEFKGKLTFEAVPKAGFRFGDHPSRMFFVPCYSVQNGYYSTDVDILYNGETVLDLECKLDLC